MLAGATGGEFAVGFKISDTTLDPRDSVNFQGVQLALPDTGYENPVEVFEYIPPSSQSTFQFFDSSNANHGAGLFMRITGNVVLTPEPGSLSLAAFGGLLLLARRSSRIGN